MATLISPTRSADTSADFTVGATPVRVAIMATHSTLNPQDYIAVEVKTASGYLVVDRLTENVPALNVVAPGDYRVRKLDSQHAIGVESSP